MPIWVSEPIGLASPLRMAKHAGNGGGADGAEADEQHAELAVCGSDFKVFHSRKLYHFGHSRGPQGSWSAWGLSSEAHSCEAYPRLCDLRFRRDSGSHRNMRWRLR